MSWLRRKGPSELEIAKENETKRGITEAVSRALKAVQKENINTEDRAVYSTETANAVCSSLEAVFLHGLRSTSVKKIANFVGLGHQDRTAEQSLNFWQFVSKFTHGEVISQLKHLGQITTEIGLCRAWIRLALNDCLMESYVDAMISDKKTLEYFYHRTCYLRDTEHPGILKAYLQGLMAFEFKLSYNSSVLNEWSYTPLILAGIIDSDDSPLPVIKPGATKVLTKEPSVQENTSVEVSRVRARSRGGSDGKDRKSKLTPKEQYNPMENPRLGQPSDNAYYVTASNFTSRDVEEFKKIAQTSNTKSDCSSSSHVSAPDPPHLNLSPADYVQKSYRARSQSNKSSSTNKSSDLNEVETKDLSEYITYDDTDFLNIDIVDGQTKSSSVHIDSNKPEAKKQINMYTPVEKSFIENLPPVNQVSEDFLKELYSDVNNDTADSKGHIDGSTEVLNESMDIEKSPSNLDSLMDHENLSSITSNLDSLTEYKNYSSVRRLDSINTEVKENAILSDILSEENYSHTEKEPKDNVLEEWKSNHPEGIFDDKYDALMDIPPKASIIPKSVNKDFDIIEAFGERVDLKEGAKNKKNQRPDLKEIRKPISDINENSADNVNTVESLQTSKQLQPDKQPSPLTESNLKQLNEELNSIDEHIEERVSVDVTDAAVKKEKTSKRKSEKRRQSKGHLKPDFSPPNTAPLKPELSPARAETVNTFQFSSERLRKQRHSLPTSNLNQLSGLGYHRQSMPNILEGCPEVSEPVSSSYDVPERLHAIYDGKPLPDEGSVDDDDTVNEDDVPIVSNQPRQSVGNSLMLSGRGWSSSFEDERHDTVEQLSHPTTDNALLVSTRPKAESFGSLLQNYTPSSSLSAPSIDDVLHNFPRTETIIAPPATPPLHSPLKQQDSAEEFEIVTNLDNPDSNLVARLTQLSEIATEKGLDAQNFQCKGCTRALGLFFGKPRVCAYDGGYYCFECHENDEYYIPARIVHNWDFRKHKVAKKNLEFLQDVEEQPHIDIEEANPRLYDHVPEIQEIRKLRTQLMYLKTYLFTCKQSTAEDFRRLIWPRDYLFENVELYSLADLLQIPTGALAASLRKVIKFATKHVYSCRLCSQKGFICELCNNPKVIYAFEMDATYRCPQCRAVYHKECKTDNRPCPKCQRRLLREAAHGLEPTTHDLASQYLHTR